VPETYADIDRASRDFGFAPKTPIEQGIKNFIGWFREYYSL
jgi:UDP-glucuronate 4-epimerase